MELEFVEGFKVTMDDLEILAKHYKDRVCRGEIISYVYERSDALDNKMNYWEARLGAIENILGRERFQGVIAEFKKEWERIVAKGHELEKTHGRCECYDLVCDIPGHKRERDFEAG